MKIIWSDFAERQLDEIYEYYSLKVSTETAQNIISRIVLAMDVLITHPTIGQAEELLADRQILYRYLIQDNYKIIYSINNDEIRISDVFDVRQSPKKIKRKK